MSCLNGSHGLCILLLSCVYARLITTWIKRILRSNHEKEKRLSAYDSWSWIIALVIVVRFYHRKGKLPSKKLLQECVIIILHG